MMLRGMHTFLTEVRDFVSYLKALGSRSWMNSHYGVHLICCLFFPSGGCGQCGWLWPNHVGWNGDSICFHGSIWDGLLECWWQVVFHISFCDIVAMKWDRTTVLHFLHIFTCAGNIIHCWKMPYIFMLYCHIFRDMHERELLI